MEDILISSPLFDPKKSKQYLLSIQLGLNGFSFCIIDSLSNKLVYLNHMPGVKAEHLPALVEDHEVLSLSYQKTMALVSYHKVSAVPSALCEANDLDALFALSYKLSDDESLHTDAQSFSSMTHLYAIPEVAEKTLKQLFTGISIKHHQSLMVWRALHHAPSTSEQRVLLTIWDKTFHILVADGEKIVFLNQFSYENIDDFLYFFLYTFKRLDLDPEETKVIIHGKIFKQSILYASLKKYIRQVEFSQWPQNLNYPNNFMELPGHYFSNLCLLHLCE